MSLAGADLRAEAAGFAETVAAAVTRHPTPDPWAPGAAADDRVSALESTLDAAGWAELGADPALLALVAPAAAELGRGLAALAPVDALLGGALCRGELARYARRGEPLVRPRAGRLELTRAVELRPLAYTDALGVAAIERAEPLEAIEGEPARARLDAWVAGSVGYMAGLGEAGLALAVEHTRARIAFGRPLAELEPVQQLLADAATLVEGLRLLCAQPPSADALAHAGDALVRASAACQQVTGALGFTLEFPLQRVYRRARALQSWADAVLDDWEPA